MGGRVVHNGGGKFVIPNFMLWAAERNGMSVDELEDIFRGMLGSDEGWSRFREVFREFGQQAFNANFGAIEKSWVAGRNEKFMERAEQTLDAINETIDRFDVLINKQAFSPIQQWHDRMMILIDSAASVANEA